MVELTISCLRLRSLPRRLLRAPSPFIELHTQPASFPVAQTHIQERTTSTSWPSFTYTYEPPNQCTPTFIGFIVRDAQNPHPAIGRLCLSIQTALVEGWFPLLRDPNLLLDSAEIYVRIWYPHFCTSFPYDCKPFSLVRAPHFAPRVETEGELRTVSSIPGCLFRCGQLNISILAEGVPVSVKKPFLIAQLDDQMLRAGELQITEAHTSPSGSVDRSSRSTDDTKKIPSPNVSQTQSDETGAGLDLKNSSPSPRRTKMGAVLKKKSSKVAKTVIKKAPLAGSLSFLLERASAFATVASVSATNEQDPDISPRQSEQSRQVDDNKSEASELNDAQPDVTDESIETNVDESKDDISPTAITNMTISDSALETPVHDQVVHDSDDLPAPKETVRPVDFGAFSFALLQGVSPKSLQFSIQDNKSVLPTPLATITDQKVTLPDLEQLNCACSEHCNTHIFEAHLSDAGIVGSKISLKIYVKHERWDPVATCTNVTPRFQEIFNHPEQLATSFNDKFPQAKNLTYLFVGGLFTQHYPTYFEKNIKYLQEKLFLPRVQTVPIHTEGSIARNAKVIRDSILKTCRGAKSVVLFGHSKGGVDVVSVLEMFPEAVPFIHGIVTFQAPFGGTFLIDFVSRSKFAVSAITSVIEAVWKGDQDAFHDMSYTARLRSLGLSSLEQGATGDNDDHGNGQDILPVNSSGDLKQLPFQVDDDCSAKLQIFSSVPCISFGSYASFDVLGIRSAANAAGIVSMAPAAQKIVQYTGFCCDGLVTPGDARVPFSDLVHLGDMMHTEPALYVQGTKYHPGKLSACGLTLLFEKITRSSGTGPK